MVERKIKEHLDLLYTHYLKLENVRQFIINAHYIMEECYSHNEKLMIAGNGGSTVDSEHIVGELMKRLKTQEYGSVLHKETYSFCSG